MDNKYKPNLRIIEGNRTKIDRENQERFNSINEAIKNGKTEEQVSNTEKITTESSSKPQRNDASSDNVLIRAYNKAYPKKNDNDIVEQLVNPHADEYHDKMKKLEQQKKAQTNNKNLPMVAKKKEKTFSKIKKKILAIFGSAIVLIGSSIGITSVLGSEEPLPENKLEESIGQGKDLSKLGIDENFINEYKELKQIVESGDIPQDKYIEIGKRAQNLHERALRLKIAQITNNSENLVSFRRNEHIDGDTTYTMYIGEVRYTKNHWLQNEFLGTYSDGIHNYIKFIFNTRDFVEEMEAGKNVNKEELERKCKEILAKTGRMAVAKVRKDGNEIVLEYDNKKTEFKEGIKQNVEEGSKEHEPPSVLPNVPPSYARYDDNQNDR